MVMNVTAGRVSADSTKVRRLSGQAPIKSCARPARSDPGVDGQIHKKTAANWRTPAEVFEEQLRSLQQHGVATTD